MKISVSETYLGIRKTWGVGSPVTKVAENKKAAKNKKECRGKEWKRG
jgi:hypothetical protein